MRQVWNTPTRSATPGPPCTEANSLLTLRIDEIEALSPGTVIAEIDDGVDDLDRLTDVMGTAAGSELPWSASAESQLPLYELMGDLFRTIRSGLGRGEALPTIGDEIRRLGDSREITRESFEGVRDGLDRIGRCQKLMILLPSSD